MRFAIIPPSEPPGTLERLGAVLFTRTTSMPNSTYGSVWSSSAGQRMLTKLAAHIASATASKEATSFCIVLDFTIY